MFGRSVVRSLAAMLVAVLVAPALAGPLEPLPGPVEEGWRGIIDAVEGTGMLNDTDLEQMRHEWNRHIEQLGNASGLLAWMEPDSVTNEYTMYWDTVAGEWDIYAASTTSMVTSDDPNTEYDDRSEDLRGDVFTEGRYNPDVQQNIRIHDERMGDGFLDVVALFPHAPAPVIDEEIARIDVPGTAPPGYDLSQIRALYEQLIIDLCWVFPFLDGVARGIILDVTQAPYIFTIGVGIGSGQGIGASRSC